MIIHERINFMERIKWIIDGEAKLNQLDNVILLVIV